MPIVPAHQVSIYNPAEGEAQSLDHFTVPVLLPDLGEVLEVAGGVPATQFAAGTQWAISAAANWQIGAQLTLGQVVTTVGMPAFDVFDTVMAALGEDVTKMFQDAIKQSGETIAQAVRRLGKSNKATVLKAANAGVSAGVGPAVNAAAVIPVLGWSVTILWNMSVFARKLADLLKKQNAPQVQLYKESSFSSQGDHLVFTSFLQRMADTRDWTLIFQAPGWGKPNGWQEPFGRQELGEGGNKFGTRFLTTNPINGAMGNVPGTGWCHQSLEMLGDPREPTDPGAFLPSTRSQAGWLWEHVIKGNSSPALYCVDAGKLGDNWATYLYDLRVYLSQSDAAPSEDHLRKILLYWNGAYDAKGKYRKVFGWIKPKNIALSPKPNEWDHYQPVREAADLADKQRAMLDTILVAYIDEDYAALKADSSLRDLWLERRQQLLSHPARCEVDITNVPDSVYRNALKDSGHGTGQCLEAATQLAAAGFEPPKRAGPSGQSGFPVEGGLAARPRPKRSRSSIGALPILAAGGAAAYAAHRGGLIRKLSSWL